MDARILADQGGSLARFTWLVTRLVTLKAYLQRVGRGFPTGGQAGHDLASCGEPVDFVSLPWETPRGIGRTLLSNGIRGCGTRIPLIPCLTLVSWWKALCNSPGGCRAGSTDGTGGSDDTSGGEGAY